MLASEATRLRRGARFRCERCWVWIAARLFPSQRLLLAFLGFLGCMTVYSHRVDLSVTLICMVSEWRGYGRVGRAGQGWWCVR